MTTNISNSSIPDDHFNISQPILDDSTKEFQKIALVILLSIVIVVVILGNTLVILAVITTRRLRTVTNCFVMSLAIADWLVGTCVMPPAVANALMGAWELGWILCDIWVSLDILLCTASILSLCAISVDRYLAVTQPLTYSRRRRSKRLALGMILIVWLSSALITCPPMFGWYEPGRHEDKTCRYNKNTGYVIFSAMGSFFIPMVVMLYVYMRISCVVAQRHDKLEHIDAHSKKNHKLVLQSRDESDPERGSSEGEEICLRTTSLPHASDRNFNYNDRRIKSFRSKTKSLRSNSSTFNEEKLTSTRGTSFYKSSVNSTRSQTDSMHLDHGTILKFEPASRVSSFRRETKTAQTLSIVMGGFIACWLPFFIFYLLTPFMPSNDINALIMSYLTWLGWFNSGINPFIYAFYSPDFRIAFWRLTVKHFSKERKPDISLHK
ncbi:octopamine receptor 1-like [Harmonia axyridis]|uniref:octopamine receptor 1-like n=1 Tax=Harmonia axyridis TaxID=115357 RepID=UPI001E274EDA|nr:octopamine receptor 1-like [Harmonia axyridis]